MILAVICKIRADVDNPISSTQIQRFEVMP